MLLVHPAHELLRQLPLLVGAVVLGSTTGNPLWAVAALALTALLGAARWFTTSYRIDGDLDTGQVQLRSGVLHRKVLSLPRNRIRSVQTEARPLHRLLGLTVLRVGTGHEAKGNSAFELDAVEAEQVPRLRSILLAETPPAGRPAAALGPVLARWQPSWLRYAPLNLSGLLTVAAAAVSLYQMGFVVALQHSRLGQSGVDTAERAGATVTATVVAVVLVAASVVLSVGRSLVVYANLVLSRRGSVVHLRHGLLRLREHTYDMNRLRGGTLKQPLLVRALGGARLDAMMTGVHGVGESSVLLPACPVSTARAVLTELVGEGWVVSGPLLGHGRRAARRRWTRALALPAVLGTALAVTATTRGAPMWLWPAWVAATMCCVAVAADRVGALGHRVDAHWLVSRAGSLERHRDCIATAGIVGWTVRQSPIQRRAGLATLVAATAAGTKRYDVLDVPEEQAWSIAATASPWVADSIWAIR